MSETEIPKTEADCTNAGGTWNAETKTCDMSKAKANNLADAVEKGNLTLEQRIMGVMQDVVNTKIKALEQKLDDQIKDLVKAKEAEMETALRKGFGLEHDPVIHQSELYAAIRKAALEQSEPEKRTPAPAKDKAGPAGTQTKEDPFDAKYKAKFGGAKQ
jgi:hypothetical protein